MIIVYTYTYGVCEQKRELVKQLPGCHFTRAPKSGVNKKNNYFIVECGILMECVVIKRLGKHSTHHGMGSRGTGAVVELVM